MRFGAHCGQFRRVPSFRYLAHLKKMKKYRVYLETSFINRLADPLKREAELRREQLLSRAWWKTSRHKYALASSALAFKESCSNYSNRRIVRLRLRIFASLDTLSVPAAERDTLAAALSRRGGPLPVTELVDAQHLAIAAIGGCRYLLTWNQKHLANPFAYERVDNVFEEHGYETPIIATPEQFLEAGL
jgi:hypothetical protein